MKEEKKKGFLKFILIWWTILSNVFIMYLSFMWYSDERKEYLKNQNIINDLIVKWDCKDILLIDEGTSNKYDLFNKCLFINQLMK
jgi:TM2 domain-containing membrane protein YozV